MSYPYVQSNVDLAPARGPRLAMVWHMAEGGNTVAYLAKQNPNGVSVHFVVERSGRVVQMLKLDRMHTSINTRDIRTSDDPDGFYGRTAAVRVMGDWADTRNTLGPNHASLAVEVEGFAKDGPNAAQTAAIGKLWADMADRYPLRSLGHRDFADYKPCPGRKFPWTAVGGHAPSQDGESMIVPQQLMHVVVTADAAHLYSGPDHGLKLPSTLPKGRVLRKFGGVPGWQFVQANYGGIQQYVWLKSDDVDFHPEPLTVVDGVPPDCPALEQANAELESANESLKLRLSEEVAKGTSYTARLTKIHDLSAI